MEIKDKQSVVYVTRDIERALGTKLDTPGYFIISNFEGFANQIVENKDNVLLIKENKILDTHELLTHPNTLDFITKNNNPNILVFKNTKQIERICGEHDWTLLNPPAELANRVEEKISQVEWLGELRKYLPETSVSTCKEVEWKNEPFILQFNRSHTGSDTHLISTLEQLQHLQHKFPDRPIRKSKYIVGPMFTSNNVVGASDILVGNISYQITGLSPFTDQPFATIGNDWGVVKNILDEKQTEQYEQIVQDVGKKLRQDGWKGLFGIDIILEEESGKLYLIEINARQPASTTFESQLQKSKTVFGAHLASLLDEDVSDLTKINNGSQIILRNHTDSKYQIANIISKLSDDNLNFIQYSNTKPDSDLLRIQSKKSVMKGHSEFNELGKEISNNISGHSTLNIQHSPSLSKPALDIINNYLHLKISNKTIPCPYFNNKRNRVRAGLRVSLGKGSAEEITEETKLIAMREKVDLEKFSEDELKKFLIEHNIGIDCSGLVYYILDAELKARGKGSLKNHLKFSHAKNPIRKILTKFRPVENTNVKVLADDKNSKIISIENIQPGDIITMLGSKNAGNPDHVLLIHKVEFENDQPKIIHYTHSLQWKIDGQYNHGVRQGKIEITDPEKNIIHQNWIEQGKTERKNETFTIAVDAEKTELRRLRGI